MLQTKRRATPVRRRWLQAVVVLGALLALWVTFRDVSPAHVAGLIGAAGLVLYVAPVAFCSAQLLDTRACQLLARRLDRQLPFGRVLVAQIAGEAATMALPLGFLVGESLRPWLLAVGRPGSLPAAVAAVTVDGYPACARCALIRNSNDLQRMRLPRRAP